MAYRGRGTKRDGVPGIAFPAPAPGRLELVQAFVNTSRPAKKPDELSNPRDLARWLSSRGLISAGARLAEEDVARAVEVRKALFALLQARQDSEQLRQAVRSLDQAMSRVRYQVRFDEVGPIGYEPVSDALDNALGTLIDVLVVARHEGEWRRLKVCGRPECGRVFHDTSVNLVGKWCSRRCGANVRGRAFRGKEKSRGR